MSGRPISPMAEGDVELGEPTVSPVIVRGIEAGHVRMDENTDVRTRSSSEFGGVNPMARGTPPTVRGKVVQAVEVGAGGAQWVIAEYDCSAEADDELSFQIGDKIKITRQDDSDWWEGECHGKTGAFPMNYVRKATPQEL